MKIEAEETFGETASEDRIEKLCNQYRRGVCDPLAIDDSLERNYCYKYVAI